VTLGFVQMAITSWAIFLITLDFANIAKSPVVMFNILHFAKPIKFLVGLPLGRKLLLEGFVLYRVSHHCIGITTSTPFHVAIAHPGMRAMQALVHSETRMALFV
jgi:hypothetical protein